MGISITGLSRILSESDLELFKQAFEKQLPRRWLLTSPLVVARTSACISLTDLAWPSAHGPRLTSLIFSQYREYSIRRTGMNGRTQCLWMLFTRPQTQKGQVWLLLLFTSKSRPEKGSPMLLKYVSQRSLTVLTFIALAVVGSVGNKSSDKRKSGLSTGVSISQSRAQQRYLSLNPRHLFENVVGSIKDAFNDPRLIEYANEQGADIPDSLTTPCLNTSEPISVRSKSPSNQSSKPSSSY